ncbi:transposase [Rhodococcus sp. ABRD24]|nr:transposase [Rhodococcus sp. ABRD24]
MLVQVKGMSERFACKVVGLHRSTFRRLPADQTPDDPDAGVRAWLREYARKNPCHGFRRAWAALRFDEGHRVNRKRVHRLWKQEGLQVRVHQRRKRAGSSSVPAITADAPRTVWALDFQFDSTVDGRAGKIASMVDEPPPSTSCRAVPPPGSRCCIWWNARSPVRSSSPNSSGCSVSVVSRGCCGATTVRR